MLIKLGEAQVIGPENIQEFSSIESDAELQINARMKKFAEHLKTKFPQASDFLYFSAIMMHAAEAALLDDSGKPRLNKQGKPITATWEKVGEHGIKWVCSDSSIKPYKNNNGDIFPAQELKTAYPKWVGRPLCLDHKSSSVDMIRGVIVDTYWDEDRQRIIALCALDKKNYPDLARKVATGYAMNVSMGTGVSIAVCTEDGCHRAAKVESDFCDHMRGRTCYGEINLGLNPLELSLVVTGADPGARVKHIIAKDLSAARQAADALQNYIDGKIAVASVSDSTEIDYIKTELSKLNTRVNKLAADLDDTNNGESDANNATGMTESLQEPMQVQLDDKPVYAPPEEIPSYANDLSEAKEKLASINELLNKLSKLSHISEGSKMTQKNAYYQGTVDPTPGKPQYPVEPGEAQARQQDKHMVGQSPFPDVGPIDGMHPGHASHEGTEMERKKKLQRLADAERREQIRREAVEAAAQELEVKRGYFQGTTEPTAPGKPQYPVEPGEAKARKEDKHMVGKKPFPEVGKVDGLYGDDAAVKEKLLRAELRAAFKKASDSNGNLDKSASTWSVYAGEHLILTASVDEITRGNADTVYDAVATPEFGKSMLKKIKADGFDAARARFKGAQEAMPAMPPVADQGAEAMPAVEVGKDESGDQVETVIMEAKESIDKALDLLQDGAKAISGDATELGGAQAAPSDEEGFAKSSLASMHRTLNSMLSEGFGDTIDTLKAHKEELSYAKRVFDEKFASLDANKKVYFINLVDQAVSSAKKTTADSKDLMQAFIRYAHGAESLKKEGQMNRPDFGPGGLIDIGTEDRVPGNYDGSVYKGEIGDLESPEVPADAQVVMPGDADPQGMFADDKDKKEKADKEKEKAKKEKEAEKEAEEKEKEKEKAKKEKEAEKEDKNDADVVIKPEDLNKLSPDTKVTIEASEYDMTTKEGRAMIRAKTAQKGVTFSDMLGKAHPQGGHTMEGVSGTGDLAKIERIDEVSKAMNDLANAAPKVKKQAQEIANLISKGELQESEVDGLVAEGVDKETIAYYKKYFAEAKDAEANQFATLLTQEKAKAATAADKEVYEVKLSRAYELAYEMRDKGIIDAVNVKSQVKEILAWNDDAFKSVKDMIGRQEVLAKTASASMPYVGLHSDEIYLPQASSATLDLSAALDAHFSKKRL